MASIRHSEHRNQCRDAGHDLHAGCRTAGRRNGAAHDDNPADLTLQSVPNPDNDSPATFLMKKKPPAGIIYRRVTPEFFVVSSIRNDRIWYNRCNRSNGTMHCVMINYPAAEKRQWDGVVTRISHTLRG
jgi:hypothetical protein